MKTMTVKQLAKLSGVSVRSLHHYDEIGLLKPAFTGHNRYRYYGREEMLRLQQILLHRESGRPRSVFAPLRGPDWQPSPEMQKFLETGLHGSFVDFPYTRRPIAAPRKTSLDLNVVESVEFLESHVEDGTSPQGF